MKQCIKCGCIFALSEFYRHAQMADGHLNACKACVRVAVKANREANIARYREHDRRRFREPGRRAFQYHSSKVLRRLYPERYRARTAVGNALRDGRLTREPCEVCASPKSEAHHDDYSKPLTVRWLCRVHHEAHHHAHA